MPDKDFQFWRLAVQDNAAVVYCGDGNGEEVVMQKIEYTDFPLDEIKIWVKGGTMFLPSEY